MINLLGADLQKKFQKKYTYPDIDDTITKILATHRTIENMILLDEIKLGIFLINVKEIKEKINNKVSITMK